MGYYLPPTMGLREIEAPLIVFLEERDWLRYNSYSSLSKTAYVEACELLSTNIPKLDEGKAKEEVGDVYSALLQIEMMRGVYSYKRMDEETFSLLRNKKAGDDFRHLAKKIAYECSKFLELEGEEYFKKGEEVLSLLFAYCRLMGFDPEDCLIKKLALTAKHYPVEKCFGVATKYDKL